jgi:hypothetical protein
MRNQWISHGNCCREKEKEKEKEIELNSYMHETLSPGKRNSGTKVVKNNTIRLYH